jgi:hypothetical protein
MEGMLDSVVPFRGGDFLIRKKKHYNIMWENHEELSSSGMKYSSRVMGNESTEIILFWIEVFVFFPPTTKNRFHDQHHQHPSKNLVIQ